MTSDLDRAWEAHERPIQEQIHDALSAIPGLRPLMCPHGVLIGDCEDEHTPDECTVVESAVHVEWTLVIDTMMPNGDRSFSTWWAYRQPETHTRGMLSQALKDL